MNSKKILTILLLLLVVVILGIIILGSKDKRSSTARKANLAQTDVVVFFYGNTCPHCVSVEEWMIKNKIEEKVRLIKKEVYGNQKNAHELAQTAQKCGLATSSVGVPFLFAEGQCFIGATEVISYLSQKTGVKD